MAPILKLPWFLLKMHIVLLVLSLEPKQFLNVFFTLFITHCSLQQLKLGVEWFMKSTVRFVSRF